MTLTESFTVLAFQKFWPGLMGHQKEPFTQGKKNITKIRLLINLDYSKQRSDLSAPIQCYRNVLAAKM